MIRIIGFDSLFIKKYILFLLFAVSIIMSILSPVVFNQLFCDACAILYGVSLLIYYKIKKKRNYFDFDSIFFITYFFVMFFYPVFLFAIDPTRFVAFQYDFNENVISRATALSLVGILAYMAGSVRCQEIRKESKSADVEKDIPTSIVVSLIIVFFALFVLTGGYVLNSYSGESSYDAAKNTGLAGYIIRFVPPLVYAVVILNFHNIRTDKLSVKSFFFKSNKYAFSVVFLYFVLMIITGGRSVPLQILLILGCLFTMNYNAISFLRFLILIAFGIVFMFGLVMMRGYSLSENAGLSEVVMDLVINNRNSFVALDYVDNNGVSMGSSMLASLLAPIPMAQGIVLPLLNISPVDASSSMIITKLSLNSDELTLGFGTNIIADLYMSFGLIGVILGMYLLGYIVAKSLFLSKTNIYYLSTYGVLCSYAVFLVRAEFFTFMSYLLWTLIVVNVTKLHKVKFILNIKKANL